MQYSNPKDYAVMDVETTMIKDGEIPSTKFWGYYDGKQYRKFVHTKDFLKFLKHEPAKVILHHTNFDVIQLLVDGVTLSILKSHNNRLIKCKMGEHYLLNSYSCFPDTLGRIFKAFGYKKTELGKLEKRNYDDCVLALECFLKLDAIFTELCGVSPLNKGTIASTGFAAAEAIAGKLPKDLRFLDAYRGGRAEVYDTRPAYVSNYDICSSYPRSFIECPKQSTLLEVRVKSKCWFAPLYDRNNKQMLHFPNGEFTSYVYSDIWEKYLEPNSPKTKISVIAKHKIDLSWVCELKDFVQRIYDKKEKSTGAIQLVCKLLLNSLYGRIGLKGESERARILPYRPDGDDIDVYPLGKKRWIAFDKILRPARSNFALAAYITDNARGRWFQAAAKNVALYGDTDSIFTRKSQEQFSEKIGSHVGEWSFKARKQFRALNVKDYVFGGKETRKGGSDFVTWTLKRFSQSKAAVSVHRTRQSGLRKRIVLADGTTVPHIVGK